MGEQGSLFFLSSHTCALTSITLLPTQFSSSPFLLCYSLPLSHHLIRYGWDPSGPSLPRLPLEDVIRLLTAVRRDAGVA